MQITIYSTNPSPRLDYVLKVCFEHLSAHTYTCTYDKNTYLRSAGAKINYSKVSLDPDELWVIPETLLFQTSLQHFPVQVNWVEGCPWLSFVEKNAGHLPTDPFASSFYLLSRYEEYLPFEADQHGRFSAAQSLAKREGFLQMAVVQHWLNALLKVLQQKYPDFAPSPLPYSFAPTYDVDMPWAFCYRPWWKQWGGSLKDLLLGKKQRWQDRRRALKTPENDPFYTFAQLDKWHEKYGLSPRFFLLMGDAAQYDTNPSPDLPAQQALIQDLVTRYPLGIHPSYWSNVELERLTMEKQRLEKISQQNITHSRQHFLKLHLPETYLRLIAAGIQADYSMGYADDTGFRAGTAVPFPWYDLEREVCTDLMIHPFVAMDVTLQQYLGFSAEEAYSRLKDLHQEVKQVGGPFCLLWHNSSFYAEDGWEGWEELYERVLQLAKTGTI